MDIKALVKIGIVAGIVMNVCDFVVQGNLLAGMNSAPVFRKIGDVLPYLILGDLVAGFVFAWLFLALKAAIGPGAGGGARFGFYAGVFAAFPTLIFLHLLIEGYAYSLAWINTIYAVAMYTLVGAVAGALHKR